MFNIHCSVNWSNIHWLLRYYKKYFKKQIVNLDLSVKSVKLIPIIIRNLYKRKNLYSLKISIESKNLNKALIRKFDYACQKGPLFLLSIDFGSKTFKDINSLRSIRFPCLALNYVNEEKYGLFVVNDNETNIILNALFVYYDYPFMDCEHTSCALKNIFIKNKKCSICKLIDMKKVITPDNIETVFMNDEKLINNLNTIVLKRKSCKIECDNYPYCKGGCFLKDKLCYKSEIRPIVNNINSYSNDSNLLKEMIIKGGTKK